MSRRREITPKADRPLRAPVGRPTEWVPYVGSKAFGRIVDYARSHASEWPISEHLLTYRIMNSPRPLNAAHELMTKTSPTWNAT